MFAPITVILSQKILFGARKMGTFWEESGMPNFSPIVYNMGSPLFVWGWFIFWIGSCAVPVYNDYLNGAGDGMVNGTFPGNDIYAQESPSIPLFLNVRTLLAFVAGCGMVPVVRRRSTRAAPRGPLHAGFANSTGGVSQIFQLSFIY